MPQTFIYVIAFFLCEVIRFFYPQMSRITDIIGVIFLINIVLFSIGEIYLDYKKNIRANA